MLINSTSAGVSGTYESDHQVRVSRSSAASASSKASSSALSRCLAAFLLARWRPSWERGPVLFCAFLRLASLRAAELGIVEVLGPWVVSCPGRRAPPLICYHRVARLIWPGKLA